MLPTPNAAVSNDGEGVDTFMARRAKVKADSGASNGIPLTIAVQMLLPTPTAMDSKASGGSTSSNVTLTDATARANLTAWGPYTAAVARWEHITRPAPAPVCYDGKGGKARLNPKLPEWMMGLDEGHVTAPDIGLSRAEQLKAEGNGVVPQQAEAATVELLMRVPEALALLLAP